MGAERPHGRVGRTRPFGRLALQDLQEVLHGRNVRRGTRWPNPVRGKMDGDGHSRWLIPLFTRVRGSRILRSLYTGSCIIAPSETAIGLAKKSSAGRTDHNLWDLG